MQLLILRKFIYSMLIQMKLQVNNMEMEYLKKAGRSEEAFTGIMNMFAKKSRL